MKDQLKTIVRGAYDIQKLRIQMGNRIAAQFRSKLGLGPQQKEDDDKVAKPVLDAVRLSYRKLTNGAIDNLPRVKSFKGDDVISSYTELVLVEQYMSLERSEAAHFRKLKHVLQEFPLYTEFLQGVRGCGEAMSGVIISEFDIHKCKYVSSMWKYAGLDVAEDGGGRSRRSEHLVDREYVAEDGTTKTRKSITFNPFLKTKLVGVLASSFLRAGGKYADVYAAYKHRLENHPKWKEATKGHRHNAAMRYMVKIFIADLYVAWKELEGLPVYPPYEEAKLGLKHAA